MHNEARIAPAQMYQIPGPELLPPDKLSAAGLEFLEVGPPGWEHMVIIVSDEPFLASDPLCRASPTAPLVALSRDELTALWDDMATRKRETWTAAALPFLVVND